MRWVLRKWNEAVGQRHIVGRPLLARVVRGGLKWRGHEGKTWMKRNWACGYLGEEWPQQKGRASDHASCNGPASRVRKELIQLNKTGNSSGKWARDSNGRFSKGDIHMASKHMQRCSASVVIRGMEIKPQWDVTSHTVGGCDNRSCKVSRIRTFVHRWGEGELVQAPWETAWQFLKG